MKIGRSSPRRGIALILVLAFLVLIAIFVVGFFAAAESELRASGGYAAGVTTAQLADTTTNIVMGQIRAATTRPAGQITYIQNPTANANPTPFVATRNAYDSWASQPGMIRTFQGGPTPSAATTALYKLYSSNYMVVQGDQTPAFLTNTDVLNGPNGWQTQPALWTDLNEPVHAAVPPNDPYVPATSPWRYPVLNPNLFAYNLGYDSNTGSNSLIGTVPGAEITNATDPSGQIDASGRPARMPVRWLYVLKDGAVTAPTGATNGGTTATWAATPGTAYPSETNPIVGRIAFWTDDDCCKVNINTAGGYWPDTIGKGGAITLNPKNQPTYAPYPGSYWDTPRITTTFDMGYVNGSNGTVYDESLALSQPRAHEYQRYPGHPSTTSLALVFNGLFSSEQIYSMAPRIMGGGSMGGTVRSKVGSVGAVDQPLLYKFDRLYCSVDELLYAEDPTLPGSTLKDQRINPQWVRGASPPTNYAQSLNPPLLDELRFFLTAHSRAPELNLFGRPRVTVWPIWPIFEKQPHNHVVYTNDPPPGGVGAGSTAVIKSYQPIAAYGTPNFQQLMNQVDTLIAFCSTIGPFPTATSTAASQAKAMPFIFQRCNAYSAQEDCGGSSGADGDANPIIRNQFLLGTYLRELTETPIPGFGQSNAFSDNTKYGADHLQILAEIFDYIRTVDLRDSVHDTPGDVMNTPPQNTAATRLTYKYAPRGIVVPSNVPFLDNAPGFGRFPTISEASLIFYHSGYVIGYPLYKSGKPELDGTGAFKIDPTSVVYVQDQDLAHDNPIKEYMVIGNMMAMFLVFETFNPMEGFAAMSTFDHNGEVNPQGFFISHVVTAHTAISGGGDFCVNTASDATPCTLYFPNGQTRNWYWNAAGDFWNGRYTGGTEGFLHTMCYGNSGQWTRPIAFPNPPPKSPGDNNPAEYSYWYPFQSTPQAFGQAGWQYLPGTNQPANLRSSFVYPGGQADPAIPEPPAASKNGTGLLVKSYPFGVITHPHDDHFNFTGGTIILDIYWNSPLPHPTKINTYQLKFPPGGPWPVPTDNIWNGGSVTGSAANTDPGGFWQGKPYAHVTGAPKPGYAAWYVAPTADGPELTKPSITGKGAGGKVATTVHPSQYSLASRISWVRGQANNPWPTKPVVTTDSWGQGNPQRSNDFRYGNRWRQILQPGDTIRSLIPADALLARPDGDARVIALAAAAPGPPGTPPADTTFFMPHPDYNSKFRHAQTLRMGSGDVYFNYTNGSSLKLDPYSTNNPATSDNVFSVYAPLVYTGFQANRWCTPLGPMVALPPGITYTTGASPTIPPLYNLSPNYVERWDQRLPDYDTGLAGFPDGGFCGKPDEGDTSWKSWNSIYLVYTWGYPYFEGGQQTPTESYFSPCRQVPSAVCFGSLLAGRTKHWETLAFCPNSNGIPTPGNRQPQDHILLDFFTMPVVEPYPISETFSTAGKININYGIIPFTHIKRSTGLRAALQSVRVTAIPSDAAGMYKATPGIQGNLRYPVDADQTLAAIDDFFAGNITGRQDIFHSASQICERYLYPNVTNMRIAGLPPPVQPIYARGEAQIQNFWSVSGALTGDNLREKPYSDLYARVTAKSNTYTVYMRVQSLRKRPIPLGAAGAPAAGAAAGYLLWDETKDQILSEYRGSATIERYLDPMDRRFDQTNSETVKKGDFIDPNYQSLEPAYKFRVVEVKRFSAY